MEPLISVIVPVYNIESYIDRCVQSIVNQTYKNLEIILVDDGSTDGSSVLCDDWRNRDSRIRVVHKQNGGSSDARNAGINLATGEYCSFVDGDDEISPVMLEMLYRSACECNALISMCRMERVEANTRFITRDFISNSSIEILTGISAMHYLLLDMIDCSACTKMYKKSLFNEIKFPYGITNEDFALLYKLLPGADRITYISDALYFYHYRENSNTSRAFDEKQFDKVDNCITMMKFVENNVREVRMEAKEYLLRQSVYLLKKLTLDGLKDYYIDRYYQMRKIIKRHTGYIIRSKWLGKKEKAMYLGLAWFPGVYKMLH